MTEVETYLSQVNPDARAVLEHIRTLVKSIVPEAEETMSYGMPALKYKGKPLVYYAAFKDHLSLFPTSEPTEMFKEQLKDFKTSKGTIQFTIEHQLPDQLIRDIVRYRLESIQ